MKTSKTNDPTKAPCAYCGKKIWYCKRYGCHPEPTNIDLFHIDSAIDLDHCQREVDALLEALDKYQRYLYWKRPLDVVRDETSPIPLYIVDDSQAARYYALMEMVSNGEIHSHHEIPCHLPKPKRSR
jgi:hypothetical protein